MGAQAKATGKCIGHPNLSTTALTTNDGNRSKISSARQRAGTAEAEGGGKPVYHCHASKTLAPARARNIRCSSPSPAWPRRPRRGSALGSTTRGRAFPVLALPKRTAPSGYEANHNIVGDRAPSRQTARAGANFNQNGYQAMVDRWWVCVNIVCGWCGLFPLWPHGCLRVALGWLLGRARAPRVCATHVDARRAR